MAKKSKEAPESWDLVVKGMSKNITGLKLFCLDDESANSLKVDVIPTRVLSLDNALGVYGIPKGRVIETYGPESSGKTTIALHIAAQAQRVFPGRPVMYVDLEHVLDPDWALTVGVKPETFWLTQPDSGEEATQAVVTAAESGIPSLIVLDSVAAVVPQKEIDGDMDEQQMGLVGRIMGKFLRKVVGPLQKSKTTLICINQIRTTLGPRGGGETRPGGNALKFFASQVMRIRKESDIILNGNHVGIWIEATIRKNKVAIPFKVAMIPLLFEDGLSSEMSLIREASEGEDPIIKKSGSWYSYGENSIGQGVAGAAKFLVQNPGTNDEIYQAFKSRKEEERRKAREERDRIRAQREQGKE